MRLTFASYNIHKAVGLDRKRDPERILSVLHEVDADIIALQEADRRIGARESCIPRSEIDDSPWRLIEVAKRPRSIGWHGNALLVRRKFEVNGAEALDLPTLEPRGAACGEVTVGGTRIRIIGTHLDLSGLRRRDQIRTLVRYVEKCERGLPTVIMGDFNQWGRATGAMREFSRRWTVITPGRSYPSRQPLATLDRIVATHHWSCSDHGVHRTGLSSAASDHLPITATLDLTKK
ncbi:endonuclease/exonuclease/phosphatase family protein [Qipengyuania sp. GH1]|uniref:endonuclease/exonuclease/phosphatase family protein n=1 Tax=Qipengyuania aestuarii TaxID=2867241 RepID=UPI001C871A0B|nr:endonuclease/exonuclease/phosphatase family protein [Qipengyuania aestuarii]